MATIETRALPRTTLKATNISFGTGGLANAHGTDAETERAHATVRAIFDAPANVIDTSRWYGQGRSEARIGEVIKERGGLPAGFIVSTKLDRDPETKRFDGDAARRSMETSLKALGLDRFDILHLHDPEYVQEFEQITGPKGATAELFKMKEEGFAGAVGLAAGDVEVMMPLLRDWDFDAMLTHNRFTLINRNAEEMIDFCKSKGMAVFNAAPYGGGVMAKGTASAPKYAYKPAPADVMASLQLIEAICARHNVPVGAAALQFSMRDPRIDSTVLGVTKPEQVAQTVEWATFPVPDAVWDELKAVPFTRKDPQFG